MKKITAAAILVVTSGEVALSAEQAKTRLHCLTPVKIDKKTGAGIYAVKDPITFKAGEEFGYDGEVGKNGVLSDPAVEALKEREGLDQARTAGQLEGRAQMRAELQTQMEKLTAGMAEEVKKAYEQGRADGAAGLAGANTAPAPLA